MCVFFLRRQHGLIFLTVFPFSPQMWLLSALEAGKVSPLIEKVSDHKDFKKLLRTRTNVLVLYTKSGWSGNREYTTKSGGVTAVDGGNRFKNSVFNDVLGVCLLTGLLW